MKTRLTRYAFAAVLLAAGCRVAPLPSSHIFSDLIRPHTDRKEAAALFAELGGDEGFLAVAHYLYRWHLDESDFKRRDAAFQRQLWIRRLQFVADEGDKSRFLEVVLPAIGVAVTLKKTDYRIQELKLDIRSAGYRVVRITRVTAEELDAGDYARFEFDPGTLYARLFQERAEAAFPSDELLARAKASVSAEIARLGHPAAKTKECTLDFAPIHAVANELWAYWEEGKILFHFTSDVDLNNPAIWAHDTLSVAIYDVVTQTVVSHEEKPGEERFITRDQVGRALYNCIVLGKKSVVSTTGERP